MKELIHHWKGERKKKEANKYWVFCVPRIVPGALQTRAYLLPPGQLFPCCIIFPVLFTFHREFIKAQKKGLSFPGSHYNVVKLAFKTMTSVLSTVKQMPEITYNRLEVKGCLKDKLYSLE